MENKNYTTKENVEEFLGETISSNIDSYILTAQQYIDNYTGRSFGKGADDEERIYSGNNDRSLIIDPVLEVTKVEVDFGGGFQEITEYELMPFNVSPKIKIYLSNTYFPRLVGNVKITGTFGWAVDIPSDINYVATSLVAGMIKGKTASEVSSERIGDYQVSYESTGNDFGDLVNLKSILNMYKKLN